MTMSDLPRESGRAQGERESRRAVEEEDGTWKVERLGEGKEGPLLDPEGKVRCPSSSPLLVYTTQPANSSSWRGPRSSGPSLSSPPQPPTSPPAYASNPKSSATATAFPP